MDKSNGDLSVEELKAERKRLMDGLCDIEDLHAFTFGKTSVHIGAQKAHTMATEYEEERRQYTERIAALEKRLKEHSAL